MGALWKDQVSSLSHTHFRQKSWPVFHRPLHCEDLLPLSDNVSVLILQAAIILGMVYYAINVSARKGNVKILVLIAGV